MIALGQRRSPERFAYLPFGIGPRVCIGAQFAPTEAILVLARLVQAFEIRHADSRLMTPVAAIIVHPDQLLLVLGSSGGGTPAGWAG